MDIPKVYIHSQTALPGTAFKQMLREGSSVYVHINSKSSEDIYNASFTGGRFTLKSKIPLEVGSSFHAVVKLQQGKVVLVPQQLKSAAEDVRVRSQFALSDMAENIKAAVQLELPGVETDEITVRLLQQMIQQQLKIDPVLLKKARLIAERFSGDDKKKAAELILILQENGIDCTAEDVEQLLALFDSGGYETGSRNSGCNSNAEKETELQDKETLVQDLTRMVGQFFQSVFEGCGRLEEIRKPGSLALLNQVMKQSGTMLQKRHWIVLPFTFTCSNGQNSETIDGCIRLLCNTERAFCEKIVINFKAGMKNLIFVLYYTTEELYKIRCSGGYGLEKVLKKYFPETDVETGNADMLYGFCTDDIAIPAAEGTV